MILQIAFPLPLNKTFDYLLPPSVSESAQELLGRRVLASFGFKRQIGLITGVGVETETDLGKLKSVETILDQEPVMTPQQLELAKWMSSRYLCSFGEAVFAFLPPGKTAKKSLDPHHLTSHFDEHGRLIPDSAVTLNSEQEEAVAKIHNAIYQHESAEFLLYGVAAAGKTEVYFSAIEDVLTQGKSVIVLVPETGLAVQMAQSLAHRFGSSRVLFWRSDIGVTERRTLWNTIRAGGASIVVGPRSAVLLPVPELGLIVVDEEHDPAYKEDRKPRFHVREVARERAKRNHAVVIYGSATPSLEIYHDALMNKVHLLRLEHRAVASSAPQLHVIDLLSTKRKGLISPPLEAKISQVLKSHGQAILYLNRRGFHRYLRCPHCSWVMSCETCGITLVAHKTKSKQGNVVKMICHTCSAERSAVTTCPQCQKKDLFSGGFGTERIEDELKEKFPWAKVLRWDRDTTTASKSTDELFEAFRRGDYDLLVGTQLVAHGFNFPGVTLVGILDADSALYVPDFRAAERTFQTIVQVAGRAGRALVTGDVVIQTKHASHPAILSALSMDISKFSEHELKYREELNYPPFSHLVRLGVVDKKNRRAETVLEDLVSDIRDIIGPCGVLGPQVARKNRAGQLLWQTLLKIPIDRFPLFLESFPKLLERKKIQVIIEPDPE